MKILWSLDVFHAEREPLRTMARLLRRLAGDDLPLQAVYVASHAENQLMLAFDVPETDRFSAYPFEKLAEATRHAGLKDESEVVQEVIYEPSTSTKRACDRLIEAAREAGADVIATYTHGKKGLSRFFLGSFAETLLYRSPGPVLLVRPGMQSPTNIKTVLFATDASPSARKAFRRFLRLAPKGARIVVYHLTEPQPALESAGQRAQERRSSKVAAEVAQYVTFGKDAGFSVKTVIESELMPPSSAIRAAAEKNKAQLIVVAAQKGATEGALVGSTTRVLLRESELPLLVLKV